MALNIIPNETASLTGGVEAQANPANYRLSFIHDETVGNLKAIRWAQFAAGLVAPFFGAALVSLATDFNIPTLIATAFLGAVTLFFLRYSARECGNVLKTVDALESMKDSRQRELFKMNGGLVRIHQRNLFLERKLAAGEADGDDSGGPSASRFRRIPMKGEVH